MKNNNSVASVIALGVAGQLVATIVQGVVGNDVADTINGSELTREMLQDQAQLEFQKVLKLNSGV